MERTSIKKSMDKTKDNINKTQKFGKNYTTR